MSSLRSTAHQARWSFFWDSLQLPEVSVQELVGEESSIEPVIVEQLCLPPYRGPKDHNDVLPLLALVRHLNPKVVLELGTAHGATVANICAMSDAQVYTINALPDQIGGSITTFALPENEIGHVYRDNGFSDRVIQIYENTWNLDFTHYVPLGSVDFAIIDACHDTDFVINDFLCVLPVLHDSSVVMFHDTHPSLERHLRDSYIACMYLRKLGFNVKHVTNTWWGIWQAQDAHLSVGVSVSALNAIDNLVLRMRRSDPKRDAIHMRRLSQVYRP